MDWIKKDTFVKDIMQLLLIGVLVAALGAAGLARATDQYFAKTVTGLMGDFGQYDLLFQGKSELSGALRRQIETVITERFPGASLKQGISVVGKTSFFLRFPKRYKTKYIYDNLSYYFSNLPGNGGYSIMTEPRINISSVPGGVFDLLAKQVEAIPGVAFTYHDSGSIGVILKDNQASRKAQSRIKEIIKRYQILEVRLNNEYSGEALLGLGKRVSQSLLSRFKIAYARDLGSNDGADDYQYMVNTMQEVKKFLKAYAANVKITTQAGRSLEIGDRLVVRTTQTTGTSTNQLQPMDIVVKVTSKEGGMTEGMIVQGDAGDMQNSEVYQLLPEDKVGPKIGTISVTSRKNQLAYGMDQGLKLLKQLREVVGNYDQSTGNFTLTLGQLDKFKDQLSTIKTTLQAVESGLNGPNGKNNRDNLEGIANLLNGTGDDLNYLAQTFARMKILENRFDGLLTNFGTARLFVGNSMVQNALGASGGMLDKLRLFDSQLGIVENTLRERVRQMDDVINRFNPLVGVLLSWRNKAKELATRIDGFEESFAPGSVTSQELNSFIASTDKVVAALAGTAQQTKSSTGDSVVSSVSGIGKIDLNAIIDELEKIKNSLPRLMDEEIGHSVDLIDKYVGGEAESGSKIQIFTMAHLRRTDVEEVLHKQLHRESFAVFSLPVGTIQPDVRGEVFKILAEVRATIAALTVIVLWFFTFFMDHSLIVVMLKKWGDMIFPVKWGKIFHNRFGNLLGKIFTPANFYATLMGCCWLSVTMLLSGARIPYLPWGQVALWGGLSGLGLAMFAEKINPVNQDEVMAGLSLGLPFHVIMREIVIPGGRPGLLQFLNRWKMKMK